MQKDNFQGELISMVTGNSPDEIKEIAAALRQAAGNDRILFEGGAVKDKLTAAAIFGGQMGLHIWRADISKYIGETEKNITGLFHAAAKKGWILFFDKADTLFGKRAEPETNNDRYANQEVSYLRSLIESYKGIIIFSVEKQASLDAAFLKRIGCVFNFPDSSLH